MKGLLRKNHGKALLTYTEMYTVLTEVEAIINTCPLTFVAISRSLQSQPTPADIPDEDTGLHKPGVDPDKNRTSA